MYTLILPALALEQDVYCGTEAHEHGDDCYEQVLSCDKEEHAHSEDCYDEEGNLTCEKEEHSHGDPCYKKALNCKKERHIHTKACYEKPEPEKETDSAQEKTSSKKEKAQTGEGTSKEKSLDAEDKKKEDQKQEDQKNEDQNQEEQKQETEDNKDSAESGAMASSDSEYTVTVTYDKNANIPEGSTLRVTKFEKDAEEYDYARNAVLADKKARGEQVDVSSFNMAALDISILNPNGEEIEPEASVQVDIKIKDLPDVEDLSEIANTLEIQHHVEVEDGVVVETVFDGSAEASFNLETNETAVAEGIAVDPNSVSAEEFNTSETHKLNSGDWEEDDGIDVTFQTPVFSTFTVTWQPYLRCLRQKGGCDAGRNAYR